MAATPRARVWNCTMQARPARGLTISANAAINDARLTQNLPPGLERIRLFGRAIALLGALFG